MSFTYKINGNLLEFTSRGEITVENIKKIFSEALGDPGLPSRARVFIDVTESEENRDPEELRDLADFLGTFVAKLNPKIALLAGRPLHLGMGNILSVYVERYGLELRRFTSRAEALDWLNQEPKKG